jgi:predicted amidohydrolase YtcJ
LSISGPDLIITNGVILTFDDASTQHEAVAIAGDRIIAVGSTRDMLALRTTHHTEVIDLEGRTLIPGLTDPHVHLADDGTNMVNAVDLRDFFLDVDTIPKLLALLAAGSEKYPAGKWVICYGSPLQDHRMSEHRLPTRKELDSVTPNHPCYITFGAHITIANSAALKLAGVTRDTVAMAGGHIEHDDSGELTGKLMERAQQYVRDVLTPDVPVGYNPNADFRHVKAGITFAGQRALERGVTTVHDVVKTTVAIRAYHDLAREGLLPLRTSLLVRVIESSIKPETLLNLGLGSPFGNDWLRIGGVKMSIDGGITGKASAFYEPYLGRDDCDCGMIRIPSEELERTVDAYHRAGHRICVHAIGDRAMDMALDAFEKATTSTPRPDHRHRIEHFGNWMVIPERLERARKMQVLPVPNLSFMRYIYEPTLSFVGAERLRGAFPMRSLLASGMPITTGSDGPAYWPADPLRDVQTAVTRMTRSGLVVEQDEAITVEAAMRVVTRNAAFNGFEENIKGSIEPGKLADLAILERNPLQVPAEEIGSIRVDGTLAGGRVVFQRRGAEVTA